jgi:hypothetical protein
VGPSPPVEDVEMKMRTRTKRIQLRIDLALADPAGPRATRRRERLTPSGDSAPLRERPTLAAPERQVSARSAVPAGRID